MFRKLISLILIIAMILSFCGSIYSEDGDTDGYIDVKSSEWYYEYVMEAKALGIMVGSSGNFNPAGPVTAAQTVALAARIHSIANTGTADFEEGSPWYQVYVDYALDNGIISAGFGNFDQPVNRTIFAAVLANALSPENLIEINPIKDDSLPDVKNYNAYASEIYRMYRAGIVSGNDEYGTFKPNSYIKRCEAATIVIRMMDPAQRISFTPKSLPYPTLTQKSRAGDDWFSGSAMVGNSLVQGMMMFSGIETMDFYCKQGVTVYSVGSYADELCKTNYSKVYIELGVNEIYLSPANFVKEYSKTVDKIKAALPGADIYVMAITPVSKTRSDMGVITMSRINAINAALKEMAREKECWFIDSCTLLTDGSGYLKSEYMGWDGSPHLSEAGYKAWAEILRSYRN